MKINVEIDCTPEEARRFLGLPDLTNRASAFIYGCWQDAKHIADHIVIQRNYDAYTRA